MSLLKDGHFSWENRRGISKEARAAAEQMSASKAYAEHKKHRKNKKDSLDLKSGYHLSPIPKGTLGEFSKIEEEFCELRDSVQQANRVMTLIELADLMGAIEAYLQKEYNGTMSLDDLRRMMETTKRAFESGARK